MNKKEKEEISAIFGVEPETIDFGKKPLTKKSNKINKGIFPIIVGVNYDNGDLIGAKNQKELDKYFNSMKKGADKIFKEFDEEEKKRKKEQATKEEEDYDDEEEDYDEEGLKRKINQDYSHNNMFLSLQKWGEEELKKGKKVKVKYFNDKTEQSRPIKMEDFDETGEDYFKKISKEIKENIQREKEDSKRFILLIKILGYLIGIGILFFIIKWIIL